MIFSLAGLLLILLAGAGAATLRRSSRAGDLAYQLLFASGCLVAAIDPIRVLQWGVELSLSLPTTVPGGDWVVGLDALSSVFLLAVLAVGGLCAIFGTHYLAGERAHRPSWFAQLTFAVLVVAIALVVVARSVVVFLGAWEVMAIGSYLLIVREHESESVRRAGLVYLVATHTATLALFAMFAMLTRSAADWTFASIGMAGPALFGGELAAILLLAVVGFGFKAGIVPLHFWLPPAHAAAPTHVSALMSGVVIKTGIYGILRVLLLLGGAPEWWGWLMLGLGIISGVLGVLWALTQHDVKRLLAYHSVENIGIISIGIGVGSLGAAAQAPTIAFLGYAGAVLHTVNHALFKSLLFLGAGAVYRAAGSRDMEKLGGIASRMPVTWLAFVIGAAAIVGLPPLNGFVSEWLIYQGLFGTAQSREGIRLSILAIPALALIGALALACFAKVAGVVFLGTPRSAGAAGAQECNRGMWAPMLSLAGACVVLGSFPILGISLAGPAATLMSGATVDMLPDVTRGAAAISLLAAGSIGLALMLWGLRRRAAGRYATRAEATWGCGYAQATPRMQYTASSFASPLVSVFGRLSGQQVERTEQSLRTRTYDLVLDGVALPLWHLVSRLAVRLRPIQQGRLHQYLLYVLAALLILLVYLALGVRG